MIPGTLATLAGAVKLCAVRSALDWNRAAGQVWFDTLVLAVAANAAGNLCFVVSADRGRVGVGWVDHRIQEAR